MQVDVTDRHCGVGLKGGGVVPVEVAFIVGEALDEAVHMDTGLERAGGVAVGTGPTDDDHMDVLDTGGESAGDRVQVVAEVVTPGGAPR